MLSYIYIISTITLVSLGYLLGDSIWWLALVNSFRYWLFFPLIIFWIEQIFVQIDKWQSTGLGILTVLWIFLYIWFPFYESNKPIPLNGNPIKVMSFNILFKNRDMNPAFEALQKADTDIIAMQEITKPQAQVLGEALKEKYQYNSYNNAPDKILGVATFSKSPLRKIGQIPSQYGHAELVEIEDASRKFYLVNIHTSSIDPLDIFDQPSNIQKAYENREKFFAEIFAYLRENQVDIKKVLLAGDFNSTEGNKLYQIVQAAGFKDSFREISPVIPFSSFTFPHNWLGLADRNAKMIPLIRIDYIFSGTGFKPIKADIVQEATGSDHRPVIMTLGILQ